MIKLTANQLSEQEIVRIGKGIRFPDALDEQYRKTANSEGMDRINQSINIILSTPVGRRLGCRTFGSKLHYLVFDPNDSTFAASARLYIKEALDKWEPRITITGITVNQDPTYIDLHLVLIDIKYMINATHTPGNLVYPFYMNDYGGDSV